MMLLAWNAASKMIEKLFTFACICRYLQFYKTVHPIKTVLVLHIKRCFYCSGRLINVNREAKTKIPVLQS